MLRDKLGQNVLRAGLIDRAHREIGVPRSREALLVRIANRAAEAPADEVLFINGLNVAGWGENARPPTLAELDAAAPGHAVIIRPEGRTDRLIVNTAALRAASVDALTYVALTEAGGLSASDVGRTEAGEMTGVVSGGALTLLAPLCWVCSFCSPMVTQTSSAVTEE